MSRLKVASFNGKLVRIPRKASKYGARSSHCAQGHYHPSTGEAVRCDALHLMQKAGTISDLKVNPSVTITKGFKYKPDFSYTETEGGRYIVEDFKGLVTQRFRDIMRMWPHHGEGVLRVTKQSGRMGTRIDKEIKGIK